MWAADRTMMDVAQGVAVGLTIAVSVTIILTALAKWVVKPNMESMTRLIVNEAVGSLHDKVEETRELLTSVQGQAAEAVKQLTENGHRNRPATAKDDLAEIKDVLTAVVQRQSKQSKQLSTVVDAQEEQARWQSEQSQRQAEHLAWSAETVARLERELKGKADRE